MAVQIQVKLDTTANPPVTMVPESVTVNRGNSEIQWTPFAGQTFTFVSLSGLPDPPFSTPNVSASSISVQDDNTEAGSYTYTIVVSYNGQNYSSSGSVAAKRTASTGGVRTFGVMGSSSPTIRNN